MGKRREKGDRIEIFYVIISLIKNTIIPIEGAFKLLYHNTTRLRDVNLFILSNKALKTLIILMNKVYIF